MSSSDSKKKKRASSRPEKVVTAEGVVWSLIPSGVTAAIEPAFFGGQEVPHKVDTSIFCYKMTCACGKVRYAKPNTLYEVSRCRLCQRQARLAKRRKKKDQEEKGGSPSKRR